MPVIADEDLPQQDLQRPAIHQDVVIGQHKSVAVCRGADCSDPQSRRVGEVADRGAFGGAQLLDPLLDVDVSAAGVEFDILPRSGGVGGGGVGGVPARVCETGGARGGGGGGGG